MLNGSELTKEVAKANPGFSIDQILDEVRRRILCQYFNHLKSIKTENFFELFDIITQWDISREDLTGLLDAIGQTFPESIAKDARCINESGTAWNLYQFMTKNKPETHPKGCFCFNSSLSL